MKKEIFNYIRSRAFRNYLFSYVGIFAIILSLLSIGAMRYVAGNMKEENIRVMESKLYTVAEDMEIQTEAMWRLAVEVASRQEFRIDYLETGKYKEIELLERLVEYKQLVDICEYYFVKFNSMNTIFTSAGTTKPIQLHLSELFGKEEYEEAMDLIGRACVQSKEALILYKRGEVTLFIYPLRSYASGENNRDGVLCFQVSEKKLQERMKKIVGIMDGKFLVSYAGFCVLDEDPEQEPLLKQVSKKGDYIVCFEMDEDSYFSWSNVLSKKMGTTFVGITILLFVLGIFVACWNFKPLRRIAEKYKTTADGELVPDWDSIDSLIDSLWRGKETNSKLLQEQYRVLREQTIQLVAAGGYSDKVKEHLELLNIRLESNVYGTIRCSFADKQKLKEQNDALYKAVEDLSGDEEILYSYWNRDGDLCVLAAVEEEYQLEEVVELIRSLFDAKELAATAEIMASARELRQLGQYSQKKNIEAAEENIESEDQISETEEVLVADLDKDSGKSGTALAVKEYIKENCTDYNLSLDMLAEEFQITPQYICKIIKQQTGVSYKEYLTGLRMEEAKRFLKDKNISVIDACQQSGYNNVSYFIKVFQRYTGMTPAKYRDEH